MYRFFLALFLAVPVFGNDWFLFTSFRRNGETGVYLALSADGRKWTPLNNNDPWIKPEHSGMLMRDPYLGQGPDGTWHLLWTWGWTKDETGKRLKIGYSSSKDLMTWTPQHAIAVLDQEPKARNAWAPEAVWDNQHKDWIMFWATTIPGRFPGTEQPGEKGYNHRIYASTTRDWVTFTTAKLWFDPGFNCIDATVIQAAKRWILIFKDERTSPLEKRLRLAFSDSPDGPWRDVTGPFTDDWVEGPSGIQIGAEWWIYFDHYRQPQHYGAVRTRDWKTFEDVTGLLSFPADHRHGTVVKIPERMAKQLRNQRR